MKNSRHVTRRGDDEIVIIDLDPAKRSPGVLIGIHWQKRVVLSCLLLCIVMSALGLLVYVNRSTPGKTLTTFCHDLEGNNFHDAYHQFSSIHKPWSDEERFTHLFEAFFAGQQGVRTCTIASMYQFRSQVVGMVVLILRNGDSLSLDYQLEQEDGMWKFVNI